LLCLLQLLWRLSRLVGFCSLLRSTFSLLLLLMMLMLLAAFAAGEVRLGSQSRRLSMRWSPEMNPRCVPRHTSSLMIGESRVWRQLLRDAVAAAAAVVAVVAGSHDKAGRLGRPLAG
jgi:hypothetical protein